MGTLYPFVQRGSEYVAGVLSGEIAACEWVRLACERHRRDLEREDLLFEKEKAERACRFVSLMPHTKGRWASRQELVDPEGWQCFILMSLFGWYRGDHRRFREAYIEVPRKNGKSLLAAAIGLFMLTKDGEYGAEVYSGATTEKQAWEVFRPARLMALRSPGLCKAAGLSVGAKHLYIESDGSRFEPVIGNPGDGASPSCALVDEYHEHKRSDLHDTMLTGMGSRDAPLMLVITTAGDNLAGPCYDKRTYATQVLHGHHDDEQQFALIYGLDKDDDWTTEEALRKANPNYGVSVSADFLKSRQQQAVQSASRQNSFRTKHLNQWVGARDAWLNMLEWDKAPEREPLEAMAGRTCYVGLDLASKVDVAVAMYLFPPVGDGEWQVFGRYYLPEYMVEPDSGQNAQLYAQWANEGVLTLTGGNVIDLDTIEGDIIEASSEYQIEGVAYDPWQATQLAIHLGKSGANPVEVRNTVGNFSEPMKEIEKLVRERKLAHGGCPILRWMASNVVAKEDAKENIYPRKETPNAKIDGVVALIMAMNRAVHHEVRPASYTATHGVVQV